MFFGYLGPLLIRAGDTELPMTSARQRVVIAVLLTRPGSAVAADELAELVWDGKPPAGAADTLRSYVMRLRRALGPAAGARIVTRGPGYLIEADADEVDAARFARCCRTGAAAYRAGHWAAASAVLSTGLALWRGDPLGDVPSQLLRDASAPPLERERLQALCWRIDADLRLGGGEELVSELRALTGCDPLRERSHALLMTALARCGRTAEALAAYQQAREVLVSQLGIEPGAELRDLHRRILAGDPVPSDGTASPAETGTAVAARGMSRRAPRQLPARAGHFAGRAGELAELDALVDSLADSDCAPIAVISGMGGIGKTTLATYWAHRAAARFPDGQLYVNLHGYDPVAPVTPAHALHAFLDALRGGSPPLPPDPEATEALFRSLMADRRMLVVLDNARDEEQVRPLLPGSAGCLTLVTSRSQLIGLVATNGAVPLNLNPLTATEARELLGRRLGTGRIDAEPAAVDQLITACTGLPLALCIAAARAVVTPTFPLGVLSGQLGRAGLDALSGTDPHADLRSVFSWSYQRLSPDAARLFRCLAALPGPDMTAPAVASVASSGQAPSGQAPSGQAASLLAELARAHLVEEHVPGRFRLHDLLARYARECAEREDSEDTRRAAMAAGLAWYTAAAAAAARAIAPGRPTIPRTAPPDPAPGELTTGPQALAWLDAERHNLVAAVRLAATLGFDMVAVTLPMTLWELFDLRGYWLDWLDTHLAAIEVAGRIGHLDAEAHLHNAIAAPYFGLRRQEESIPGLRRALSIWQAQGRPAKQAAALGNLSRAEFALGRTEDALRHGVQAAALARVAGDHTLECRSLCEQGWKHHRLGQLVQALDCYVAARKIAVSLPDSPLGGMVEANFAELYRDLDRADDAIIAATAALANAERSGSLAVGATAHRVLGDVLDSAGQHAPAVSHWRAALAAYHDLGDPLADDVAARLGA
jgi:DNA-binding SARP family transcriptional activator/tetratricopeptide (TPR) repeat protein